MAEHHFSGDNAGLIEVEWESEQPAMILTVMNVDGEIVITHRVDLGSLEFDP